VHGIYWHISMAIKMASKFYALFFHHHCFACIPGNFWDKVDQVVA
jgi:hypothetical protein